MFQLEIAVLGSGYFYVNFSGKGSRAHVKHQAASGTSEFPEQVMMEVTTCLRTVEAVAGISC